jgi:hypothetical protein
MPETPEHHSTLANTRIYPIFFWHNNGKIMARPPNDLDTETITLSTTPHVNRYLRQVLKTGLYGKNPAEAAERLLTRALEDMLRDGRITRGK